MVNAKKAGIVLLHAFIGWVLCAATMGIGMAITSPQNAILIHAVAAPLYFIGISRLYFGRFNYTRPFPTAMIFTGFVIVVDFFVVALLILRSLAMFASLLGTWIPFALIFTATYSTGLYATRRRRGPPNI